MAGSDDELARTATAGPTGAEPTALPPGSMLGRYRLERELGSGGMGVVHAAFDPDLERRVALKVLRTSGADEAKRRLLREARAMARLAHPNVITVHEVGTANGRDYVAMEIVDGETLAEWLRVQRRTPAEIVEAFVAAGRGLAAAHAAGIVHRDFKPHNVLRSRSGRIVVTDFGLAREVTDPLAVTRPIEPATTSTATGTPSTLAGLTMTGSLLGTPAYMAPEQWNGGAVTAATDQFAFCVALWEALSGARPYPGPTVEDLRAQVARGPRALDASGIPRRLRDVLRRGLDPDPGRRWSSVEALLAQLGRGNGRSMMGAAIGAAVVVAGGVVVLALSAGGGAPAEPACVAPALDPAKVWSPAMSKALAAAGQVTAAGALDRDFASWVDARRNACAAEPARRGAQLSCLDGVLARFDAVARASETLVALEQADVGAWLIDPAVCSLPIVPRVFAASSTPALREVIATSLRDDVTPGPQDLRALADLSARVANDPCASAWARSLLSTETDVFSEARQSLREAEQDVERCADDRIRAEIAMFSAMRALSEESLGTPVSAKLKLVETAVARVTQPDLVAAFDLLRSVLAIRAHSIDDAIEAADAAAAGFARRGRVAPQVSAKTAALRYRGRRGRIEDIAAIAPTVAELRALTDKTFGPHSDAALDLDAFDIEWTFFSGDVAGAHAKRQRFNRNAPQRKPRRIVGTVVDARRVPVEGATVTAARQLAGDAISVDGATAAGSLRTTKTRPDGTFVIPDAVDDGVVVAQWNDQRSLPVAIADSVALELGPTSRIEGHVKLRGQLSRNVAIIAQDDAAPVTAPYFVVAPVQQDGSFVLEGVRRGRSKLIVALNQGASQSTAFRPIEIKDPIIRGIELELPTANRTVHIVVRSTVGVEVPYATVFVLPGKVPSAN
ncbi:MAG: protein kinase, partial [Kofleriaceae bacterium]